MWQNSLPLVLELIYGQKKEPTQKNLKKALVIMMSFHTLQTSSVDVTKISEVR